MSKLHFLHLVRDTPFDYIWRAQICIFGIFGGAKYGQVGCPWKDHIILVQTNLSCFSVTWEGNILLSLQLISPNSLSCVWWSSERWQTCKECYLEPRTRQEAKWARDRKWRFEQKRTQQCLWQKTYRKTFYKMKGKINGIILAKSWNNRSEWIPRIWWKAKFALISPSVPLRCSLHFLLQTKSFKSPRFLFLYQRKKSSHSQWQIVIEN